MVADNGNRLRVLAAEIRAELQRIAAIASEVATAKEAVKDANTARLSIYGTAALLENFYTGVEKVLSRVASVVGASLNGPAWHRRLLDDATLDLPKLRPPVLSLGTARLLEPYLAFRHRFRNLYLFDLDARLLLPLVESVPDAWVATRKDLLEFCFALERIADDLDQYRQNGG
jgi:hypothetical protein